MYTCVYFHAFQTSTFFFHSTLYQHMYMMCTFIWQMPPFPPFHLKCIYSVFMRFRSHLSSATPYIYFWMYTCMFSCVSYMFSCISDLIPLPLFHHTMRKDMLHSHVRNDSFTRFQEATFLHSPLFRHSTLHVAWLYITGLDCYLWSCCDEPCLELWMPLYIYIGVYIYTHIYIYGHPYACVHTRIHTCTWWSHR